MAVKNATLSLVGYGNGSNVTYELPLGPPDRTELYVVMGILAFLSVVGTAGNALVLYVFAQKRDRLVSTLFIIVLAFVDFITCLIVIPYTVYMEYIGFFIEYDVLCKGYQFLITSNIPFSALIMVAIAIDRYFCICHPFLHALNIHRAKVMVIGLGLFAAGLGICVGLMYGVYQMVSSDVLNHNHTHGVTHGNDTTPAEGGLPPHDTVAMASSPVAHFAMNVSDTKYRYHGDAGSMATTDDPGNATVDDGPPAAMVLVYSGFCDPTDILLSSTFRWYYQKFYTGMYLLCLIVVIFLYTLIYRSVLRRRTRRQKQKSKSLPLVVSMANERTCESTTEETLLTTSSPNGDTQAAAAAAAAAALNRDTLSPCSAKNGTTSAAARSKERRKSTKKDRQRMANLKTAAMLFVVTVVFIVTFLPAFLMALQLIPHNMTIFYMYFANNVANPIIYSFMNKNFREDLKKLFCR